MSKADALVLPKRLDAAAAAALWRTLGADVPAALDFSQVEEIDSSALALVYELKARAGARGLALVQVPERFARLCAAHRVEQELLG